MLMQGVEFGPAIQALVARRLGGSWQVSLVGAALVVRGTSGLALVDLPDLAVRAHTLPDLDTVADGVVRCLGRNAREGARPRPPAERLVPTLWRGDQLPASLQIVRRPFVQPLWMGYGVAEAECTLAVTAADLKTWGLSARDVHELALEGLRQRHVSAERVVAGSLYAWGLGTPDPEGACHVLAPEALSQLARRIGARRFLVGLPARSIACVLRWDREEGTPSRLDRLRGLAARYMRTAPFPLATDLLMWHDGLWEPQSHLEARRTG